MDFYSKYKSPLGYQTGENQIDSYGVDHSGFTLRDEIAYQMARQQRENQIIKNYNNQGITQDYPQAGTNFWGGSSNNNYGFGSSNIHDNIENRKKLEDNMPHPYNSYSRYNRDCSVHGVVDNFLKIRKDTAVEKPFSSGLPAADSAIKRIPIIGKYINAYNLSSQIGAALAQGQNAYQESCQSVNKKSNN